MKYAVIKVKGKQYKVKEGDTILVDKINEKDFNLETLLIVNDKGVNVGKPYLGKSKVKTKVLETIMGRKLHVQKYKAKSRYRKKIGFRPKYSKLLISKIT